MRGDLNRYADKAAALNVSGEALYNALLASAENMPDDWNLFGRQADAWKQFGMMLW
jgi:hypothetical protein